jgi:hypothetical protein
MTRRSLGHLGVAAVVAATLLMSLGCSINTLGGREKCWAEADPRAPSLWRGTLVINSAGGHLATPEGDVIPLIPGAIEVRGTADGSGELVRGSDVIAKSGDEVTLFGGAGADGALIVCALEEVHSTSLPR